MNSINRDYLTSVKAYEQMEQPRCDADPWRLKFHIMPPVGWLNDPNGLTYYKGRYYVYFQYSPFSPEGGMKCWGLYTSSDMVHWEYEGVKLCPDETFDVHGVYSGSALAEEDAVYLYYTGNVKKKGDFDYINQGREGNTVCVRTEDGIHYEEKKLLMTNEDYGSGLTCHVRDPKVWKQENCYYMLQGARGTDEKGRILVFRSEDKMVWSLIQTIESDDSLGYMWECPDAFCIDGQWILCFSPQGMKADGCLYQNVYQSGYCLLDDTPWEKQQPGIFRELDRGFDYYAPQSFLAPDGRRIQIGWMGLPDIQGIYENPTVARGWQHAMTIPRELTVRDGVLYQNPIRELSVLRQNCRELAVEGDWQTGRPGCMELWLEFEQQREDVKITLDGGLILSYDASARLFELRFEGELGAGRTSRSVALPQLKNLRLIADTSSVEIFLNDGAEVFTSRFYPGQSEQNIAVTSRKACGYMWEYGNIYPTGHLDNTCPAGRRTSCEKVYPTGHPDNTCPSGDKV